MRWIGYIVSFDLILHGIDQWSGSMEEELVSLCFAEIDPDRPHAVYYKFRNSLIFFSGLSTKLELMALGALAALGAESQKWR